MTSHPRTNQNTYMKLGSAQSRSARGGIFCLRPQKVRERVSNKNRMQHHFQSVPHNFLSRLEALTSKFKESEEEKTKGRSTILYYSVILMCWMIFMTCMCIFYVWCFSKYIQRWNIINHLKNCIGRHNKARIVMIFGAWWEKIQSCVLHIFREHADCFLQNTFRRAQ